MTSAIWEGDLLNREAEAKVVADFLRRRTDERARQNLGRGYVLNLDSSWGAGKTYFLTRLRDELKAAGHLAAYVNGWLDDASDDPAVTVVAAIEAELSPHLAKKKALQKAWQTTKSAGGRMLIATGRGVAKQVMRRFIGDGVEEIISIYNDTSQISDLLGKARSGEDIDGVIEKVVDDILEKRVDDHRRRIDSIGIFKKSTASLIKNLAESGDVTAPFFVLIDELDRCRPTYAISMLESVKHLFDVDGLVFIVATDTGQLAHSVKAVYGESFDAKAYLRRFFDRKYSLKEPKTEDFIRYLFRRNEIAENMLVVPELTDPIKVFAATAKAYDLSLRDIEQCFDLLHTFLTLWNYKVGIQFVYLLPLIIAVQTGNELEFEGLAAAGAAKASKSPWMFGMTFWDRTRGGNKLKQVEFTRLLSGIRSMADTSLPELNRAAPPTDEMLQWIRAQFNDEFSRLHNDQSTRGAEPFSIIRKYPEMVLEIGQWEAEGE